MLITTCYAIVCLSPAHRDGKVKNREHGGSLLLDEEICDDGGSNGGVTGLTDPH